MKRMMIYAMVGVCTMGVGVVSARAAELTNQGTTTTDEVNTILAAGRADLCVLDLPLAAPVY